MSITCNSLGGAGHGTFIKKEIKCVFIVKYIGLHGLEAGVLLTCTSTFLETLHLENFMAFIIVAT